MKRNILNFMVIILFLRCGVSIPIKFPKFPDGTEGKKLKQVLEGKRKVGVVAKELPPAVRRGLDRYGLASEWQETIRAAMKTTLEEYGYYIVVDIDSRSQRYDELARSQTGITRNQQALGQELNVDHLFYVNMTAVPRVECKIELLKDAAAAAAAALQLAMAAAGAEVKTDNTTISRPTGVLYLTVFVEGTLVNVETGRSISYSVQEPYRLENQVGNQECPSELVAFNEALKNATKKIADRLSPRVVTEKIPLEEKDKEIEIGDKKTVELLLQDGIKWIEAGDIEQAIKSWDAALEESGGTSKAALWNLAVAKWYQGDLEKAQKYFDQVTKMGGTKFIDSKKRQAIAIFKIEKKRIEEEGE
jgi:tetratricopeptide (TPR) repeat protein